MAIITDLIFQNKAYVNVRNVEIDKDLKKFVIRLNIYNNKSKSNKHYLQNGDEHKINKYKMIEGCRSEAEKIIKNSDIKKAIKKQITEENKKLRKEKKQTVSAEKAKRRAHSAVETEISKLQNEIGTGKFNKIFDFDINETPVFQIAYNYLKNYVYDNSKDA